MPVYHCVTFSQQMLAKNETRLPDAFVLLAVSSHK